MKAKLVLGEKRRIVHLPPRRAMHNGLRFEDADESFVSGAHLRDGPVAITMGNVVLPQHVIKRVNADFESAVADLAHQRSAAPTDIGSRQQCAVKTGHQPVVMQH